MHLCIMVVEPVSTLSYIMPMAVDHAASGVTVTSIAFILGSLLAPPYHGASAALLPMLMQRIGPTAIQPSSPLILLLSHGSS
jgi:hypothetical protein